MTGHRRGVRKAGAVCLALALAAATSAWAQTDSASAPAPPARDSVTKPDTALDRRVIDVATNLRCPVCQNLSILDSPSELAQDMKRLVRDQLAAGRTRDQIEAYFVERYGEWVLLKPRASGATLTVWVLPGVLIGAGGLFLWFAVRRWIRRPDAPGVAVPTPDVTGTPAELSTRRDALRVTLAELDEDFQEGKVTQQDYDALRLRDEAELAAVRAALKTAKTAKKEPRPTPAGVAGRRRMSPVLGWTGGVAVFGVIAVLSLRGAVKPRSEGGSITGIDLSGGSTEEPAPAGPMGQPVDTARVTALEVRVARDSTDHAALIELGHLYLQQQRLQRAAAVSMKAVELRPRARESAEAFAHLGMILWGAQELEAGLQAVDQALVLSPDHPEALLYKGILMFAGANNPKGAVTAWERYLEVAPPGADTDRVRGMLEAARQAAVQ